MDKINPYIQNSNMVRPYPKNEYVYMKTTNYPYDSQTLNLKVNKVFVNPNFQRNIYPQSTIHVNPNIGIICDDKSLKKCSSHRNANLDVPLQGMTIHINPKLKNFLIPQTVHINPKFKSITQLQEPASVTTCVVKKPAIVLTKTKLIRAASTPVFSNKIVKRRNSIKSKFKIVKTIPYIPVKEKKNRISRFKVDHRRLNSEINNRKYVFVNKLQRTSDLIKNRIIKPPMNKNTERNLSLVKISGVMYKKSPNSLRKTSLNTSMKRPSKIIESKYKLIKKQQLRKSEKMFKPKNLSIITRLKIVRKQSPLKFKSLSVSPKKLKICNIPCPLYQKYGVCRRKVNGKCSRKHDPAQVALCTRFLQGACLKAKCLLSHQVSSEKMPTCKFYLEGSCVKEYCPYLHVKLNHNAEICRDFLEGFCKKAAECDKRHQYLCPEYEKYGNCPKQRCPYPHGNMVRSYFIHKNKFVKNCTAKKTECVIKSKENDKNEERQRYYLKNQTMVLNIEKKNTENFEGLQFRPKLGTLPSFIPFNV